MSAPGTGMAEAAASRIEDPTIRKSFAAATRACEENIYAPERERATAPRARYRIMFSSGWEACAEAMRVVASFGVERIAWSHAGCDHQVDFTATFDAMKSVQHAVWACGVSQPRCVRLRGVDEA